MCIEKKGTKQNEQKNRDYAHRTLDEISLETCVQSKLSRYTASVSVIFWNMAVL